MLIHELNTFSGTLGDSDFLATDNGTDTSKVSAKTVIDDAVAEALVQAQTPIATAKSEAIAEAVAQAKCYYGTCSTSSTTVNGTRTVTSSGYELTNGGIIAVDFTYAVPSGSYLNVNSKGAIRIKYQGANLPANVISAGDTAYFMYNGTNYILLGIDKMSALITDAELTLLETALGIS